MRRLLSMAALGLAVAGPADACAPGEGRESRSATIDRLMEPYAGDGPGASLLVMKNGVAEIRRGYGLADLDTLAVATPTTNYRLASITKQFTATAVLLLAEQGKLRLEDPVGQWLPSLPPVPARATLHQLLTHSAGLVDYEDLIAEPAPRQLRDADVLTLLEAEDRTVFEPGTGYRYSNSAYALLALVVERASGLSFQQFLKTQLFDPLAMRASLAFVASEAPVPERAYGYSKVGETWQRTDQSSTSAVLGDGGIYSSIDDLARWDAALYDDRLLSDASRKLAFAPQVATDDPAVRYGYGWRITGDTMWHSGETMGFRNVIIRAPDRRLTVVLLSNRNAPEPYETAKAIASCFSDVSQ